MRQRGERRMRKYPMKGGFWGEGEGGEGCVKSSVERREKKGVKK
uniref:Uncharacterized protein n=1 Tax=Anguilla anguilla TaxID=7936 RepID=A0A0E9W8S5_ANGAN